jgi:hypothetical protein
MRPCPTVSADLIFAYHAVPTNFRVLSAFRHHVVELWRRALLRRSQKDRTSWTDMDRLADRWLPKPRISHPWPSHRFRVKHPRWEPYAGIPLVRFCAGAPSNGRPYRDRLVEPMKSDAIRERSIQIRLQICLAGFQRLSTVPAFVATATEPGQQPSSMRPNRRCERPARRSRDRRHRIRGSTLPMLRRFDHGCPGTSISAWSPSLRAASLTISGAWREA